jgi:flagellar hook-associated protein 3 FlgL
MSGVSTIGQSTFLNSQLLNIESQLNDLTNQVSSGKKSDTFSGIASVSQLSLQLSSSLTNTNGYLTNISNATTRIQPVQGILQQITDIANQLRNDALNASSDTLPVTQGNGALQAEAQDALNQISALLNTKVGNDFLFGGRASSQPPMPNFGSLSNASSIIGQVGALTASTPLTNVSSSGDQLYNAIQSYLRNDVTHTAPTGASAPSALGYAGETGEPGGSAYRFTNSATVLQGATAVTLAQTADLPVPGQYIEFGTIPPQNAAYLVTSVVGQTVNFQRVPAGTAPVNVGPPGGFDGVSGTLPVGTAINVVSAAAVTQMPNAVAAAPAGTTTGAAAIGATSIQVSTISNYHVGDRVSFSAGGVAPFYDVTFVDPATSTISFVQSGAASGGITAVPGAIAAGANVSIFPGQPPGSTIINLAPGGTTGVTTGMSVKFSNSSTIYHVVRVISGSQIEITQEGTSSGAGLTDPLPSRLPAPPTVPGTDVTASFGAQIPTQSVQVDNALSVQYGIRADDPAFRTVLGAIFSLATTNLNTTTQAGFRQLAARAAADLQTGSSQVTTLAANLGVKQQSLDSTQQRLNDFTTTLQTQLSNLNDVDMASAVSQLTQTQTQLEASFKLLSTLKDLSLANYL